MSLDHQFLRQGGLGWWGLWCCIVYSSPKGCRFRLSKPPPADARDTGRDSGFTAYGCHRQHLAIGRKWLTRVYGLQRCSSLQAERLLQGRDESDNSCLCSRTGVADGFCQGNGDAEAELLLRGLRARSGFVRRRDQASQGCAQGFPGERTSRTRWASSAMLITSSEPTM
jgi:hypothetical protein